MCKLAMCIFCVAGSLGIAQSLADTGGEAPAAPDLSLAGPFLTAGREAYRAGNTSAAVAALGRAVQHDAGLAEAHYLLAKIAVGRDDRSEAVEHFRRVVELVAADAGDEPGQWREEADRQLKRLCVYLDQWDRLRREYVEKYRQLGLKHKGLPSGVCAFEAAAVIAPEIADVPEALALLRSKLPQALDAPVEKPDAAGAKLLVDQAAGLRRKGKHEEAAALLRSAESLLPSVETLAALAEAYLSCEKSAEAAVALAEAQRLLSAEGEKANRALWVRVGSLQRRADPGCVELGVLHVRFAGEAESLARRAMAGGDRDAARTALGVVLTLLPDRDVSRKILEDVTGEDPLNRRLPRLTSKLVACRCGPVDAQSSVTERTVSVKGVGFGKPPGTEATLEFSTLSWGRSLKATWRLELHELPPPDKTQGTICFYFWPLPQKSYNYIQASLTYGTCNAMVSGYAIKQQADTKQKKAMYREDRSYEITVEKAGRLVSVSLDGQFLVQVELTEKQDRDADAMPVMLWMYRGYAPAGEKIHLSATLLEFSCSPDCIHRKPLSSSKP